MGVPPNNEQEFLHGQRCRRAWLQSLVSCRVLSSLQDAFEISRIERILFKLNARDMRIAIGKKKTSLNWNTNQEFGKSL
jgi:hypothetical protein